MVKGVICSAEVQRALAQGRAVVALESTIIAHGMPYPDNLHTAHRVEEAVRQAGAVPATVAVVAGQLRAGLSSQEIDTLAQRGSQLPKVSRRDLPLIVARQQWGATTVAATMIIAEGAGIRVFATGGIGGVHRGASKTFDVSADLPELGRSSVAVVSAGAKSILDLALTLEYLETLGVPVVGYQTDEFPAFYTRSSGLPLSQRADSPQEIAALLAAKWQLGLSGGVLIANPIAAEHELTAQRAEAAIAAALQLASAQGIRGKELTPFLLQHIQLTTQGESLSANIALVLSNARLAAAIAVALADRVA